MVECVTLAIRLLISTIRSQATVIPLIRSQATVIPLLRWLSTKHNLIDLAEKAFPASESKNTSEYEIANIKEVRINMGVQELNSKGLIDIVEEIKNGGPDSQ